MEKTCSVVRTRDPPAAFSVKIGNRTALTSPAGREAISANLSVGLTAADGAGNLYVADSYNSVVRKISTAGVVSTVVGTPGKYGFVPGALPGVIPPPEGLTVNGNTLYITARNGVIKAELQP